MNLERVEDNDGIGTPETRALVDAIARGKVVAAETILAQVNTELATMTDLQLVDLHHCLQEWEIKAPTLWPHLNDWEKTVTLLTTMLSFFHGLVGTVAGMLIWVTLQVKHSDREERMKELMSLVQLEIEKRRLMQR